MRLPPAELLLPVAALAGCAAPPGPSASAEAMAGLRRQAVAVDGETLSWLEAGPADGRILLFVHGTPGDATGWADYLLDPQPGFRAIAVDRPGFGRSGPDGAVPSLARQAAALAALLPPGGRAVVVGHSLGAPIAVQLALDHPGRIAALVLVAGSLDPGLERIHWAQPIGAWGPVARLLPRALRNANAELMALKPQLKALEPRLATLQCPVFVVHGTRDDLVPFANTDFMARTMPGARFSLQRLEGRNHFLPWNSRADIAAAVARAAGAEGPPC